MRGLELELSESESFELQSRLSRRTRAAEEVQVQTLARNKKGSEPELLLSILRDILLECAARHGWL